MGTTTYTHNEHSVQCGDIHYGYLHYRIDISIVGTLNMRIPIISKFIMDVLTLGVLIMRASIVGTIKMAVSILDTTIKGASIEGQSILGRV